MPDRTQTIFAEHLGIGALVVAAGSAAGLWLPPGVALVLAGIALCRICWLEDNIHHDLLPTDRIPAGYRACRSRRRWVLGLRPGDNIDCPRLLAAQFRLQSFVWAGFAWATAAGVGLASGMNGAVPAAAITLALALRAADYFAWGQVLVLSGRPLPHHVLTGRSPLAALAVIHRSRD